MKFHFNIVQDLVGFATKNVKAGENSSEILTRALLTSDDQEFYQYSEQISNIFLNKAQILTDVVYKFLIIIHQDLSADLYINDFGVEVEIQPKRDIKQGEIVTQHDIADIQKVKFPQITITETDKIIYCFKIGWRFGLFFDLTPRIQPTSAPSQIHVEKLDIKKIMLSIGDIYRYLYFYHVYKVLESDNLFDGMLKDGWFPFVEIVSKEYKELSEAYKDKFDFKNRISAITNNFTEQRIKQITKKWWDNEFFNCKKILIQTGVNAYLQNTAEGYISCIKNLWPEIEGILRKIYFKETQKGNGIKSKDLIAHIIGKAKKKTGSDYSLLLPLHFLTYLKDFVFANFNIETGDVNMSRNTSGHGVADTQQYTKTHAIQLILILDQIYFYH